LQHVGFFHGLYTFFSLPGSTISGIYWTYSDAEQAAQKLARFLRSAKFTTNNDNTRSA
jgi:hypothetical protein